MGTMRRVLVVEDNALVARTIVRTLSSVSCVCETADSVAGARARLESSPFDMVIVDANLGDERGQDLVAEIRTRFPATETVLASGVDKDEVDHEAVRCGAHRSLAKPFTLEALIGLLGG
jgi:DNA-binding NtrC family response regulator